MHIDKFKTDDGYCDKEGTHYEDATDFIFGMLGFCEVDGHMFAAYEKSAIDIFKGIKGIEFNNQ